MVSQEFSDNKKTAAIYSILASAGMSLGKLGVGISTGSLGIISEAIHSFIDFLATLITYFAVRVSDIPADDDHHYGHQKIESLAALAETVLLFATSGWIIYEAAKRFTGEATHHVDVTWYALAIIIISIVVDFFRSRNLLKVARESGGSQALEADALHFSSDMWSSGAVLVGLVGVLLGFAWADTVGAIAVSVFVLHAGFKLGKRTIEVLIDTAPPGTEARLREIVTGVTGVQFVGTIRVRTMEGTILITEIEVGFPSKMTVGDAFKIKQKVTLAIQETFANAQVIVHSSILD